MNEELVTRLKDLKKSIPKNHTSASGKHLHSRFLEYQRIVRMLPPAYRILQDKQEGRLGALQLKIEEALSPANTFQLSKSLFKEAVRQFNIEIDTAINVLSE